MRIPVFSALLLALLACTPTGSVSANDAAAVDAPVPTATKSDFDWSGTVKKGGKVSLANVSGDVEIVAAKGDTVRVSAKSSGRDADLVEVMIDDGGGNVVIRTELGRKRSIDVRVDYRIEVPAGVRFEGHVVSGDVEAKGFGGALALEVVSGDVRVSGSGDVRVQTVDGDAEIALPKGAHRAMLEAVSGTLEVSIPDALGLDLAATSLSGRIDSELKHERTQEMVGSHVRISRGDRTATVRLETVSGRIAIRKS